MNKNVDEIFSLLEKEEYLSALNLCGELIDCFQTRFMEDLTVNTATDYVGAVILHAKICSVIKKPWKSYNYLETSRGALRFLKDFMTDSNTLAETYNSYAEAYAQGSFLPEAVSCFVDAARYFDSKEKCADALSNAFFYQARFGKKVIDDLSFANDNLGKEKVIQLKKNARDEANSLIQTDPIESSDAFLAVRYETEKITDEILAEKREEDVPFCLLYWETKKNVLKERFSIDWKSPADMNPDIRFY